MDVTKETFPAVCDQVINFVKTCDFYAIDCELTGVMVPAMPEGICDTPERNYALKGTAATRYSIIQFGLCTFHADPSNPKNFIARPFNFFLFPSEHPHHLGGGSDRTLERDLILNPGAISFNRRFKMDFQKWIYHGVEYCNGPLERKMEEFLDREATAEALKKKLAADRSISLSVLSSADEKNYFEKCEAMAKEFVKDVSPDEVNKRPKELMLPSTKSRTARETTQAYLEATYSPKLLVALRGRFPNRDLCLVRTSSEEMTKLRERQDTIRSRRLLDFVGFRTVFKAMVESKKPIVGHNCLVDLLFMQTAFDEPLNLTSLQAYKKHFHSQFPLVFDTKAIAVNTDYFPENRFDSKSLEPLFNDYRDRPPEGVEMPTFSLPLGFQAYEELTMLKAKGQGNSSAHEAGYDAMMTGQVLLKMLTEAKKLDFSGSHQPRDSQKEKDSSKSKKKICNPPPKEPIVSSDCTTVRVNKSSSGLFDEAARTFGNYIHLHRSLYLLDVQTVDQEKEKNYEGGVSDVFTATNGVVLITYKTERILAHHILESQILSIGYEGCKVLEVLPGIAVLVLSEKSIEDICARNSLLSSHANNPFASVDGQQCHYYSNPKAVLAAVKEINDKHGHSGNLRAEMFIPYHARKKDGSTIAELTSEMAKQGLKISGERKPYMRTTQQRALGECTHPSIAATILGEPSPFSILPPEVLAAAGFGGHIVQLSPLPPSVVGMGRVAGMENPIVAGTQKRKLCTTQVLPFSLSRVVKTTFGLSTGANSSSLLRCLLRRK